MKSPEFIAHGSASPESAKSIRNEGFRFEEGRETASSDFFLGMDFAQPREDTQEGSRNQDVITEGEPGSLIVMQVPDGFRVDYGTEASQRAKEGQPQNVEVDLDKKEIKGHLGKYSGGRKQLGTYQDQLTNLGINIDKIQESESPMVEASRQLGDIELSKKVDALKKMELIIESKNIAAEIKATPKIIELTEKLKLELTGFKKSIPEAVKEIADEIENENKESDENVHYFSNREQLEKILQTLLEGSVKNSIQEKIRLLSLDIKMLQGYKIEDTDKIPGREFKSPDPEAVAQRLRAIEEVVGAEGFTTGISEMDNYLSVYLPQLQREFDKIPK